MTVRTALRAAAILVAAALLFSCVTTGGKSSTAGSVVSVVTAKSLDPAGKTATGITSKFSATDKQIVVAVTLKDWPKGSRCEYVRYLNGKYLDHGSVPVKNPAFSTVFFIWTLSKDGAQHLKGQYQAKVYVNGNFKQEISYVVD